MINEIIENKWENKIINKEKRYAVVQIQKRKQVEQLATVLYKNSNIFLSRKFQIIQEILDLKVDKDIIWSL